MRSSRDYVIGMIVGAFTLASFAIVSHFLSQDRTSGKSEEKTEVQAFHQAVRKFIADANVAANAWERRQTYAEIERSGQRAADSYIAIPFMKETSAIKEVMDLALDIRISLDNNKAKVTRQLIAELEAKLKAVK